MELYDIFTNLRETALFCDFDEALNFSVKNGNAINVNSTYTLGSAGLVPYKTRHIADAIFKTCPLSFLTHIHSPRVY